MFATLPSMTPLIATAGIGWLYYRRIRRQFGRQPWKPGVRFWLRVGLLSLLMATLCVAGVALPGGALAILAGACTGAVLGGFAIWHTRIETANGARWYTPNPWIGGALSLLLVARLAWRWQAGAMAIGSTASRQAPSALTLAFAATLVAYYLVNSAGLAWRMRRAD